MCYTFCLTQLTTTVINMAKGMNPGSINSPSIVTPTRALQLGYGQVNYKLKS